MTELNIYRDPDPVENEGPSGDPYLLGQWYWVKDWKSEWADGERKPSREYEWFGCVVRVGSNYVEINSPHGKNGCARIHFENAYERLRRETNPQVAIQGKIAHYQQRIAQRLAEVQVITARLGVSTQSSLEHQAGPDAASGQALAVLSGQDDVKQYETALVKARDKDLPELFEAIRKDNEHLCTWLSAESLPLEAMAENMKGCLSEVKTRIGNVSLYAGLTESVVQCTDGEPADFPAKLHVMQRRLYMDEECLLGYQAGGIDIRNIEQFDAWLAAPQNRDRILPFARCIVAMRVRRKEKRRDWGGSLNQLFINMELSQWDKLTLLYIRNGERIYRLETDLEFGELIFPEKAMFDPGEPMMVKMVGSRVRKMISVREYDERVREYEEYGIKSEQWKRDNPMDEWKVQHPGYPRSFANPYSRIPGNFNPRDWGPFDPSNVYYDDCVEEIKERIDQYNRIALIIQGLFDRSDVLHPHPPVRSWTPGGFAAAIELVYDGSTNLYHGEPSDFEAYRARCNAQLDANSVVVGQDRVWQMKEAEKENRRRDRDWRTRSEYRPEFFQPYGNPGPGYIAKMSRWQPRSRKATFTWYRKRLTGGYGDDKIRMTLTVSADDLFNVSAYQPGDYLQFFRDPRTRAQYLEWAPVLLAAEEYHAGNLKPKEPVYE